MPVVAETQSLPLDAPAAEPASGAEIAAIAKALGHPARIHIVRLLLEEPCVGREIVGEVGLAQSTVSEHLRILKAAGIIMGEIEHPRVCYSLNPDSVAPLAGLLGAVFEKDNRCEVDDADCCPPAGCESTNTSC